MCVKKFYQEWSVKDGEALSWTSCFELIVHAREWIDYGVDGKNLGYGGVYYKFETQL